MVIDVSFKYDGRDINVKSNVAKYSETLPANVGLSRARESELEQIEFIGMNMTAAEMAHNSRVPEQYKINRVFRVINPFLSLAFEPHFAYLVIHFFCRKSHLMIKPKGIWRELLGLDNFDLTVQIAEYRFVSIDKKEDFEKLLRKISRKVKIEP